MLHLWLDADRKRNTRRLLDELCARAAQERKQMILLVPEQFSHMAERQLCQCGGDRIGLYAEVLSFSRLANRVFSLHGGAAQAWTDPAGKLLLMSLAVEQVRSRLKIYALGSTKPEFLLEILSALEELRSFCVTPAQLRDASRSLEGVLGQKIEELSILMESYDAACANCGQCPDSRLTRLLDTLRDCDYADDKTLFLDGFTDLNGIERAILSVFLERGAEVHVNLQCDALQGGMQPFAAARETARQLLSLARQSGTRAEAHTALHPEETTALPFLRTHLFAGSPQPFEEKQEQVVLLNEESETQMCRSVAGEILRLIAGGARWRDISVACTAPERLLPALQRVFDKAQIPLYISGDQGVLRHGAVRMLLSALQAASEEMEQESVLAYLKSGFLPLTREACDRLEDYIFLWNIDGNLFSKQWQMHPDGLEHSTDATQRLAALNEDRLRSIGPLLRLRAQLRSAENTGQMVTALYEFTEQIGLEQKMSALAQACAQDGRLQEAQEYVQLYALVCDLLEQMYGVLGATVRTPEEFYRILKAALSVCTVGTIPARLDCVTAGGLMAQRRSDTPYVFLLGAQEGLFPSTTAGAGLLTDAERTSLMAIGIGVAPTTEGRLDRELAAIYSVLSAPDERLYLCAVNGTEAYLYHRAAILFPNALRTEGEQELVCRSREAYVAYLLASDLTPAEPELAAQLQTLRQAKDYHMENISAQSVTALYGQTLRLSSSKIDLLASCRLAYFLNYGLRARERKRAQVDPSVYGTFVHSVLERTAKRVMAGGGFHALSVQQTLAIAQEEMERYSESELADLWTSERARYLFQRSFHEVRMVVAELHRELSHSDFVPQWFELRFADGGDVPAVRIAGERMTAKLEGMADRADVWQDGDRLYVRVVDYKTGKKSFDYTSIFNGLQLQMLLYLFTLERCGGKELTPAGVLYFPARIERISLGEPPEEDTAHSERMKAQKRSGLLLKNDSVLEAMETPPLVMPYKVGRDGEKTGDLATTEEFALLRQYVFSVVAQLGDLLYSGAIRPDPYYLDVNHNACSWCPYGDICRSEKKERTIEKIGNRTAFWEKIKEATGNE